MWHHLVVRVTKEDVLSLGTLYALIAGSGHALIAERIDVPVLAVAISLNAVKRIVGASVVDEEHLIVGVRLRLNARHTAVDVLRHVVAR